MILAIKPQVLPIIMDQLTAKIAPAGLVLSIVAGAPMAKLVDGLGHAAVIRSMPNISAQVGEGMVVWTATPAVSDAQRQQGQAILQAMGHAVYVAEEKQLDMATAINGSGPAYVFLFMEAMVDAGVRLGFSRPVARELVLQTVLGFGHLCAPIGGASDRTAQQGNVPRRNHGRGALQTRRGWAARLDL